MILTKQIAKVLKLSSDPRELPAYSISEAAHYLGISQATLRSWILGRNYNTGSGMKFFKPLITLPSTDIPSLSFINLVEAYVLDAIRKKHEIALPKVRKALDYLQRNLALKRPLAESKFETDGLDLFISKYGDLINITQEVQIAMRGVISAYLQRIERDEKGLALKLYPFTRKRDFEEPRHIVIDPFVAFGKPIISGKGIPTSIIAERYKAGETMDHLANDYGCDRLQVEEAVRCELDLAA